MLTYSKQSKDKDLQWPCQLQQYPTNKHIVCKHIVASQLISQINIWQSISLHAAKMLYRDRVLLSALILVLSRTTHTLILNSYENSNSNTGGHASQWIRKYNHFPFLCIGIQALSFYCICVNESYACRFPQFKCDYSLFTLIATGFVSREVMLLSLTHSGGTCLFAEDFMLPWFVETPHLIVSQSLEWKSVSGN